MGIRDGQLFEEYCRVSDGHQDAPAFHDLLKRARVADDDATAALCLGRLVILEKDVKAHLDICREYAQNAPSATSYKVLGSAERDSGHLSAARRAFLKARSLLDPASPKHAEIDKALHELDLGRAGNRGPVDERIASRRATLAVYRAKTNSVESELRFLRRHLRSGRAKEDKRIQRIYLDALIRIARAAGKRRWMLPYVKERALLEDTPAGLQKAALDFEAEGQVAEATRLLVRALRKARKTSPESVAQLTAKIAALRSTVKA